MTQKGIDLFPVIMAIAEWSIKHQPVDKKSAEHAQYLLSGGDLLQQQMIAELKEKHLT